MQRKGGERITGVKIFTLTKNTVENMNGRTCLFSRVLGAGAALGEPGPSSDVVESARR
jgi:hypothetical protein